MSGGLTRTGDDQVSPPSPDAAARIPPAPKSVHTTYSRPKNGLDSRLSTAIISLSSDVPWWTGPTGVKVWQSSVERHSPTPPSASVE